MTAYWGGQLFRLDKPHQRPFVTLGTENSVEKNKMKLQHQLQQMKFKVLCISTLAIVESTTTKHLLQFSFIAFSNTELPCL